MLGRTKIKVLLSPSSLEVQLARGETFHTVNLEQAEWESHWKCALSTLDATLETCLKALGIAEGIADVTYLSPGATAELVTMPLAIKEASGAAMLRLREAIPGAGIDSPATLTAIPTTKATKVGEPRSSLFCVADRGETTEALAAWLTRAGLTPGSFSPANAETLRAAVSVVMTSTETKTVVVFSLGRHTTAFAGGTPGDVHFARAVGAGYEMLIEAYARALRACGLSNADPAAILFRTGIPDRDQVIDEATGIRGDRITPLLQPVLQRIAIEIKQTLRFGLPEGEAARASLTLSGPGAAIGGLTKVLAAQLDIPVNSITPEHASRAERAARSLPITLTTMSARLSASRVRLRMAVQIGAAAAAIFIASDFTMSRRALASVREEVRSNMPAIDAIKAAQQKHEKLSTLKDRLGRYDLFLYGSVGEKVSLAAAAAEMSRLSFAGLRLAELVASRGADGVTVAVKGSLPVDADGKDELSGLMDRLTKSPMFESVTLASKQSSTADDTRVAIFSLILRLAALDPDAQSGTSASIVGPGGTFHVGDAR